MIVTQLWFYGDVIKEILHRFYFYSLEKCHSSQIFKYCLHLLRLPTLFFKVNLYSHWGGSNSEAGVGFQWEQKKTPALNPECTSGSQSVRNSHHSCGRRLTLASLGQCSGRCQDSMQSAQIPPSEAAVLTAPLWMWIFGVLVDPWSI